MKRTWIAAALAGMLVAVAACGGSTATVAPAATPAPTVTVAPTGSVAPTATGGSAATSADRAKFVGTWAGHYGCSVGAMIADKMIVKAGSGDLDLSITIHSNAAKPDTVTGTLTSATEVSVPQQTMGGAPGTAKLTLSGNTLDFRATGMGMTCGGSDYTQTALPDFVGEWERHGKQADRPYTEHLFLNADGTYSIETRFDDTDALLTSSHGTYQSTETTLTLTDQNAQTTSAPYYLDASGKLVLDNKTDAAWTRVH